MKLIKLFACVVIAVFSSCNNIYKDLYIQEKENFNIIASSLNHKIRDIEKYDTCNLRRGREVLFVDGGSKFCFSFTKFGCGFQIEKLFINDSIESIDIYEDQIFFNLSKKRKIFGNYEYLLIFTENSDNIDELRKESKFKVDKVDEFWYLVRYKFSK